MPFEHGGGYKKGLDWYLGCRYEKVVGGVKFSRDLAKKLPGVKECFEMIGQPRVAICTSK